MLLGNGRRPIFRDFHHQNRRNPERCHLTKVSGFTIISANFQSKSPTLPRPASSPVLAVVAATSDPDIERAVAAGTGSQP